MYGYPFQYPPPDPDFEKVAKTVIKLMEREKKQKLKAKDAEEKKAKASSAKMMSALEWFIIGVLMQPVVGPLGSLLVHKLHTMIP